MDEETGNTDWLDSGIFDLVEKDLQTFDPSSPPEPTLENTSFYATEEDGCLYHYCGNTRIKVTEHFADKGKVLPALIENVIQRAAINKSS